MVETTVRIGDAERERATDELGDHFAAGRLTHAELDERLGAAWGARSADDLRLLFADLPAAAGAVSAREVPARRARPTGVVPDAPRWSRRLPPWQLVVVLVVVAAIAVPGPPWPLFVLFWLWIVAGRRRHFGSWGPGRPALPRAGR